MTDENGDKYLDPEFNPMIPGSEPAEPDGEPDKYLDPRQNPLIPGSDESAPDFAMLNEKLSAAFPEKDEVEVGGALTLIRMANGNYSVKQSGRPLSELPLGDLMMISDFLKNQKKN